MCCQKCFVVFYVFSFPADVYVRTLNLIASIPDPSVLTYFTYFLYKKGGMRGYTFHGHVFLKISPRGEQPK